MSHHHHKDGCPTSRFVKSQDILYMLSRDILYIIGFLGWSFDPAFDDRRTLDRRGDFSDQGGAEEDEEAIFYRLDVHPFASQCFADPPALPVQVDRALAVDLEHPRALRILPDRRVGIVTFFALAP